MLHPPRFAAPVALAALLLACTGVLYQATLTNRGRGDAILRQQGEAAADRATAERYQRESRAEFERFMARRDTDFSALWDDRDDVRRSMGLPPARRPATRQAARP